MDNFVLNSNEKVLIENNIKLAYWKARKWIMILNNPSLLDELISCCEYALIKAIHTWDSTREIKLVTYASVCMDNQIKLYLRQNSKVEIPISSLTIFDENESELVPIELMSIATESDVDIDTVMDIDNILQDLPDREFNIIYMYYYVGYNEREISQIVRISQSYVSRLKRKALKTIKIILSKKDKLVS